MIEEKSKLQSRAYEFPYHHLADLKEGSFSKKIFWGLDYYNFNSKIIELAQKYIKNDILDIGCGDGFLLINLKKYFLKKEIKAVGIDLDKKPILYAQAFSFGLSELDFINGDIGLYDEKFNLITCIETLEHIPDCEVDNFIKKIDNHLLKDGVLIASVPSKNIKVLKKHYRHYDASMLKKYFSSYKVLEECYITRKNNIFFKFIQFLICNEIINFLVFKKLLFYLNRKFFYSASSKNAGHIIIAFKK